MRLAKPFCLALIPLISVGGLAISALPLGAQTPSPSEATPFVYPSVSLADGKIAGAKEPQAAVGTSGQIYVTFGAGKDVYASVSRDRGKTFASPVRVGNEGNLSLGMRRGPRIVATKRGAVVSAIYGKAGGGQDGELFAWRTEDGGRTWLGPARVNDVSGAAREGLHGMTVSPDGTKIACTWLDLRAKGTQLFSSVSSDGGKTWSKNVLVYRSPDGSICECCHPSLVYDAQNRLHAMWRNSLGGARDMYLATSSDGGKTFAAAQKLGVGTWLLNACPMDGGALAVSPKTGITTFWRRDNMLYLVDASGAKRPEKSMGPGQQGTIAKTDGGTYLAWLRGRRPGTLMVSVPTAPEPMLLAEKANNPVLAAGAGANPTVVLVWSDEQGVRSATLAAGAKP